MLEKARCQWHYSGLGNAIRILHHEVKKEDSNTGLIKICSEDLIIHGKKVLELHQILTDKGKPYLKPEEIEKIDELVSKMKGVYIDMLPSIHEKFEFMFKDAGIK